MDAVERDADAKKSSGMHRSFDARSSTAAISASIISMFRACRLRSWPIGPCLVPRTGPRAAALAPLDAAANGLRNDRGVFDRLVVGEQEGFRKNERKRHVAFERQP